MTMQECQTYLENTLLQQLRALVSLRTCSLQTPPHTLPHHETAIPDARTALLSRLSSIQKIIEMHATVLARPPAPTVMVVADSSFTLNAQFNDNSSAGGRSHSTPNIGGNSSSSGRVGPAITVPALPSLKPLQERVDEFQNHPDLFVPLDQCLSLFVAIRAQCEKLWHKRLVLHGNIDLHYNSFIRTMVSHVEDVVQKLIPYLSEHLTTHHSVELKELHQPFLAVKERMDQERSTFYRTVYLWAQKQVAVLDEMLKMVYTNLISPLDANNNGSSNNNSSEGRMLGNERTQQRVHDASMRQFTQLQQSLQVWLRTFHDCSSNHSMFCLLPDLYAHLQHWIGLFQKLLIQLLANYPSNREACKLNLAWKKQRDQARRAESSGGSNRSNGGTTQTSTIDELILGASEPIQEHKYGGQDSRRSEQAGGGGSSVTVSIHTPSTGSVSSGTGSSTSSDPSTFQGQFHGLVKSFFTSQQIKIQDSWRQAQQQNSQLEERKQRIDQEIHGHLGSLSHAAPNMSRFAETAEQITQSFRLEQKLQQLREESKMLNDHFHALRPRLVLHQITMEHVNQIIDLMNTFPHQTVDTWKKYIQREGELMHAWTRSTNAYYDDYLQFRMLTVRKLEHIIYDALQGLRLYISQAFAESQTQTLGMIDELTQQFHEYERLYTECKGLIKHRHMAVATSAKDIPGLSGEIQSLLNAFQQVIQYADATHLSEWQAQLHRTLQTFCTKLHSMSDNIIRDQTFVSYVQLLDKVCLEYHANGAAPCYARSDDGQTPTTSAHVSRAHEHLEPGVLLSGSDLERRLAQHHRVEHAYHDESEMIQLAKQKQAEAIHAWNVAQQENQRMVKEATANAPSQQPLQRQQQSSYSTSNHQ